MSTASSIENWYALAVVAGQEQSIAKRIMQRLDRAGQLTADMEVLCPEEEVVVDAGTPERRTVRRQTLPGYLLIRCRRLRPLTVGTIMRVRGVIDFMGGPESPTILPQHEVQRILGLGGRSATASLRSAFAVGDQVKITDGPMADFTGVISDINLSSQTAQVDVEIFGRSTPTTVALKLLRRS